MIFNLMGTIIKIYSNKQIKCLSFLTSKIQFPDTLDISKRPKMVATSTFNNRKTQESKSQVSDSNISLILFGV